MKRCTWADSHPLNAAYHDEERGVPSYDDVHLFEMLTLEGAQAGLSWTTILKKRDGYRRAFAGFDPHKVARFSPSNCEKLLQNPDIVRNRLKVESTVNNAKALLRVQREFGSFAGYIWQFVDGRPIENRWKSLSEIPAESNQSKAMSKDLKKRGFRFVGSTICYAFMQAVGMVNDHEVGCDRRQEIIKLTSSAPFAQSRR